MARKLPSRRSLFTTEKPKAVLLFLGRGLGVVGQVHLLHFNNNEQNRVWTKHCQKHP